MNSQMMLAARYPTATGELRVETLPRPEPATGEVLVSVRVSGVNPTDWKARSPGSTTAGDHGSITPNQDGAGVIVAVGQGIDPDRVGERVWLWQAQWERADGTAAQFVALPAERAVALPDGVSLDLGAGLGIPAMTAHRCLFADGPIDGAHVLVTGGAGAVGHAAIELARWGGARVAATVSSDDKAQLARAAGAELVVNYRTEDVVEAVRAWAPDGVRRVVDVSVEDNLKTDTAVLAPGGVVSSYAVGAEPVLLTRRLMTLNAEIQFVLVYTMPDTAKRQSVEDITTALRDGALTELPAVRFALDDIAAAHDAVEAGAVGKVLVDIPR
jgi:NADPH2:quinone reductase